MGTNDELKNSISREDPNENKEKKELNFERNYDIHFTEDMAFMIPKGYCVPEAKFLQQCPSFAESLERFKDINAAVLFCHECPKHCGNIIRPHLQKRPY